MKHSLVILFLTVSLTHAEMPNDLLRLAETNNPSIAAARSEWEAANSRATLAGALPDPRLSYSLYLEEVQTKTGPQEQKAGISQTFPMFGKRALREESAAYHAAALYARYRAVRADVLFQVQKNLFDLHYLDRALRTEQARSGIFQTLEQTAERAVENGADARDLLDIQISLAGINDSLNTLNSKRKPLEAEINALLNRDTATQLTPAGHLPEPAQFIPTQIETSPVIAEQHAALAQRQSEKVLAGRNHLPDITLGLNWIQTGDGGEDPLLAGIALNLPLWGSKNRAERLRAEQEESAQQSRLKDQTNRLQARLVRFLSLRNDAARRTRVTAEQMIPPAEQHFELTRTAYENGETDLRELITSEERLLNLRLMLERSRTDRAIAEAEIEKLLGGPK